VFAVRCQRNRRNLTDADIARCVQELDKRRTKAEAGKTGRDKQLGQASSEATDPAVSNVAFFAVL